jgi:hypothetical protein
MVVMSTAVDHCFDFGTRSDLFQRFHRWAQLATCSLRGDWHMRMTDTERLAAHASDKSGGFVISLDFELMWGVRDKKTISDYGRNILGARKVVPRLLDAFSKRGVACTWATVGMLFFDNKDELLAALPTIKPTYRNSKLSPYNDIMGIGKTEKEDPYHYGLSLIKQIRSAPKQEIGTHTFSHYYCLEEGGTLDAFEADLEAARIAGRRIDVNLRSVVFPRNQYSQKHVESCRKAGFIAFRGNEKHPIYRPVASPMEPFASTVRSNATEPGSLRDASKRLRGSNIPFVVSSAQFRR